MFAIIFEIVIAILLIGLLSWLVRYIPWIDAAAKQFLIVVIIVVIALYLIASLFGFAPPYLHR